MALGGSSITIRSGGGVTGPGSASLSRQLILCGVSPGGTINTVYKPASDTSAATTTGGVGPLAQAAALAFRAAGVSGGPPPVLIPMNPATYGDCSAVSASVGATGTFTVTVAPHKTITILCTVSGTIATCKFRFSLDGGSTYSDEYTSSDTGGGNYVVRVPGTFTTLQFAAASYVATKTNTVDTLGTVTAGSGWVGTVTISSVSPIDVAECRVKCVKGGALGVATVEISLDNGDASGGGGTSLGVFALPSSGKVVVPNAGFYVTGSGTLTAGEVHSFLATAPGYATADITNAITALRTTSSAPTAGNVVLIDNFSTQTTAFAAAAVLDTALDTALSTNSRDYQGLINCPCSEGAIGGDVVYSSGSIRSAVTSTNVNTAAQAASALDKVSIFLGAHRVTSVLDSYNRQRTTALIIGLRALGTTPKTGVANRSSAALDVYAIGRDELFASVTVHDNRINCLQTVDGLPGVWLAIESGGLGWRNFTADANLQDADAMRMVNACLATLRPVAARLIGQRPRANTDGTIYELDARRYDRILDSAIKGAVGLEAGSNFTESQASDASASVDRSSVVGASPYTLKTNFNFQRLGFISNFTGDFVVTGGSN